MTDPEESQSDYVADETTLPPAESTDSSSRRSQRGGPLWMWAGIVTGQSRADTEATAHDGTKVQVGKLSEEERYYLKSCAIAEKRVKTIQLLVVGVIGLMLGWLGNLLCGTSCHFVNVPVQAGQNGGTFSLHFGLWKYSPADSAMSGYPYCLSYEGSHDDQVPLVSRISNVAALVLGTYSLVILWWHLVTGKAHRLLWGISVWTALVAAGAQMSTLFFFFDTLCQERVCSWGPASFLAIFTAAAWAILGFEMYYQAPYVTDQQVTANLENVELSDLHSASIDYLDRFSTKPYNPPEL